MSQEYQPALTQKSLELFALRAVDESICEASGGIVAGLSIDGGPHR
jgi:hypothetical protein